MPERPEGCFAQKVPVTFSVPADVVVVPIGFLSDHIEILWDLDTEARAHGEALGLNLVRAATVGTHPRFVAMVRELVAERIEGRQQRSAGGAPGPCGDACPPDCCLQG